MSSLQIIVMGGILFILYRFLLDTIGVERLGIWSIVLATTSVANIATFGITGSVIKFVAKYLARGDEEALSNTIQTAAVSVGAIIGFGILAVYPFVSWLLGMVIPLQNLEEALSILPYSMVSLWLTAISSVFLSGIDGHQRFDLRTTLFMTCGIVHLLLAFILVPTFELHGLAYAQIAQSTLILLGSWLILKRFIPLLPLVFFRWNRTLFIEMLHYGANVQITSITQMLTDPVTKTLITKFGGLSMAGFYEMAYKMVMQVRALLISVNQVMVPAIADLHEREPHRVIDIYKETYLLLSYLAIPIFSAIIAFAPIISEIWLGYYEHKFIFIAVLLAIGYLLNTLGTTAYYSNLGTGRLRWNTIGLLTVAVLNVCLGLILGPFFGGWAIVATWVTSLIIGSAIISIAYHVQNNIPVAELLVKENKLIVLTGITAICLTYLVYDLTYRKINIWGVTGIAVPLFCLVEGLPLWNHPMRKRLSGWLALNFHFKESKATK